MNVIRMPKSVCQECRKREATRLCDKVKGEWQAVGHPPTKGRIYRNFGEASGVITCDAELCEKCAIHITGMDLCPRCAKEIKKHLGDLR